MTPASNGSRTKKLIAEGIRKNRRKIWEWHLEHTRQAPPPLYCSIDLRDSGHKIVPVDSNLYPAGFNNICPEDQRNSPHVMRAQLEAIANRLKLEPFKKVLILPESHTSNLFYIENLYYLSQIIHNAGFEVRIGWYGAIPAGNDDKPAVHLTSQRVALPGEAQPRLRELELIVPAMLVVTALRMSPRCDRRLLWGAVILVHAAAARMCHTLDVVSP